MSLQRQNALIKIGGRWCSLQLVRRWSKSVIQNTNAVISDKKWRETWIENTSNSFHNRSLWTDILHNSKNRLIWFNSEFRRPTHREFSSVVFAIKLLYSNRSLSCTYSFLTRHRITIDLLSMLNILLQRKHVFFHARFSSTNLWWIMPFAFVDCNLLALTYETLINVNDSFFV